MHTIALWRQKENRLRMTKDHLSGTCTSKIVRVYSRVLTSSRENRNGLGLHERFDYLIARAKMNQPTYFPARSAKRCRDKMTEIRRNWLA